VSPHARRRDLLAQATADAVLLAVQGV